MLILKSRYCFSGGGDDFGYWSPVAPFTSCPLPLASVSLLSHPFLKAHKTQTEPSPSPFHRGGLRQVSLGPVSARHCAQGLHLILTLSSAKETASAHFTAEETKAQHCEEICTDVSWYPDAGLCRTQTRFFTLRGFFPG